MTNKINTKCKIIDCAKSLFSKHGIHGTSVRDIAREANVNLAAINYHFKSKENLYLEIFHKEYESLSNLIEQLFEKSNSLEELSSSTFKLLKKNGQSLLFVFQSFLNLDIDPKHFYSKDIREFGPIGSKTFLKQLNLDLKTRETSITLEKKMWLIRSLLSAIIHFVISLQSPLLKKIEGQLPILNASHQKESIENIAKALFASL